MSTFADRGSSPARDAITVTPSDATVLQNCRGFRVGTAGNVAVVTRGGTTLTIPSCQTGETVALEVTKILSTGTTASNITAFIG